MHPFLNSTKAEDISLSKAGLAATLNTQKIQLKMRLKVMARAPTSMNSNE
jgi:hypothetical protein